jgi:hypothetical protein
MASISASVGRGGVNKDADVRTVQELLNKHVLSLGLALLLVDGDAGPNTTDALKKYQKVVVGLSKPDGRIDPGGKTWQSLSGGQSFTPPSPPAPASGQGLSGTAWWHANQANFPNSSMLADLDSPFRENVIRFTDALKAAGAKVRSTSTRRNPARAYLMHWCWKIAKGLASPTGVPAHADCAIKWDHGHPVQSKKAAQEMVQLFGIAFQPSLTSLHIQGKAIDMAISWTGTIHVEDANGKVHAVGAPRNGNANPTLHAIGKTYGVKKLASDPPHWSETGH